MKKHARLFVLCGAILLTMSLTTQLVLRDFEKNSAAVSSSQFSRLSQLGIPGLSKMAENVEKTNKALQSTKNPAQVFILDTVPSGARVSKDNIVWQSAKTKAPLTTPTVIELASSSFQVETAFHSSIITKELMKKDAITLQLRMPYFLLSWAFLPGLVLVALGLKESDKSAPEETSAASSASKATAPQSSEATAQREAETLPRSPATVRHDPKTPKELIFGRFVKGELIGEGAMGNVYKCESAERGDDREFALKVLKEELSQGDDFRQRFIREANICQYLDHPNIVRCHEYGEKEGAFWMVMDFIPGGEMQDWLSSGPPLKDILTVFKALCDGLEHAHNRGVLHRDLKPQNILLPSPERPVIADFGLAKGEHYKTITKTNTTLGTPAYMPPEQITGGTGTPQGDLYSLGGMLYEALEGKPPYDGLDVLQLLQNKLTGIPPDELSNENATEELKKLINKLLSAEPLDRYQSAVLLKESLIKVS